MRSGVVVGCCCCCSRAGGWVFVFVAFDILFTENKDKDGNKENVSIHSSTSSSS